MFVWDLVWFGLGFNVAKGTLYLQLFCERAGFSFPFLCTVCSPWCFLEYSLASDTCVIYKSLSTTFEVTTNRGSIRT